MHRYRFAVHVRHVGKLALFDWQLHLIATRDEFLCKREGKRVLRECARRVSKDVALELIEHDDFGKSAFGQFAPGEELAMRRRCERSAKALGDHRVKRVVFGEVLRRRELVNQKSRTA